MTNPYHLTPEQLAGLRRGAAALARFDRLERGLPAEEPCACPDPDPPRRRPVVVHGLTAAERHLLATGPPPPPPEQPRGQARRGRVTLADAKRLPQPPPWLRRLTASGYRQLAHTVTDNSVACAWCGVRHRRDWQCEAMRNRHGGQRVTLATERLPS